MSLNLPNTVFVLRTTAMSQAAALQFGRRQEFERLAQAHDLEVGRALWRHPFNELMVALRAANQRSRTW